MKTTILTFFFLSLFAFMANAQALPANPQTGDILYYDGSNWQGLHAGTAGAVLTMGANGKPFWKAQGQPDSLVKVTMTNGNVIYVSPVDNNPPDAPDGLQWGSLTDITALTDIQNLAAANKDFAGQANTDAIVSQLSNNNGTAYAAKVCTDLVAYGYDDWYLPAAGELNEMYKKLGPVANGGSGQITTEFYWSSSEYVSNIAWIQNFENGFQDGTPKFYDYRFRCVRR